MFPFIAKPPPYSVALLVAFFTDRFIHFFTANDSVILCANKDDNIVEYAMSRSLSPTLVADYSLKLIDKKLLEEKLSEYIRLLPDDDNSEQETTAE